MVKLWSFITAGVLSAALANAVPLWGQCGGQGWNGSTVCDAGSYCYAYNPFYSQCIPIPSSSSSRSSSRSTTTTRTTTASTPTNTGVQFRAVTTPVFNYYLQSLSGTPVLGPQASAGYFTLNGSIRLNSSPALYLNIGTTTFSYKPLTFGSSATFTGWALEGDTLVTVHGSTYGRNTNFLACPGSSSSYYTIYLQTGSEKPDPNCATIDLHLPCLGC